LRDLILQSGIDGLLDVGANQGQYVQNFRALGFGGPCHSFEPSREAFNRLEAAAAHDQSWEVHNVALGSSPGVLDLHISADSVSSSLLVVADQHIRAAPRSTARETLRVQVRTLDSYAGEIDGERVWLKLDTQGYESHVLAGAIEMMNRVAVMQCEFSIVECYADQADYWGLLENLHELGFRIRWVEPGTQMHDSGELLQFDAILSRQ
jgi:FkbM family methyltransferase